MLVKTIEILNRCLGGVIAVTGDITRWAPFLEAADNKYIAKAIGREMYAELDQANTGYPSNHANYQILEALRKSAAFYAYYEYSAFSTARQTDVGLEEPGTEKTKAARQFIVHDRRNKANETANFWLEQALSTLHATPNSYPTWRNSAAYADSYSLTIQQGAHLGAALPESGGSHRLYLTLRPFMAQIELYSLPEIVGDTLLPNLKARLAAGTSNTADSAILPYLRAVVATAAYDAALPNLVVVQTPDSGLRVLSEFEGVATRLAPTAVQLQMIITTAKTRATEATGRLRKFLATNSSSYPDYTSSSAYSAPASAPGFLGAANFKTVFPLR